MRAITEGGVRFGVPQAAGKARDSRTVPSEDIEVVEEQRILDVTHILCSCLLESSAVYDPSFTCFTNIRMCSEEGQRVH